MKILDYMKSNILVLDGAMGTELAKRGLVSGRDMEWAAVEHPDIVRDIHREYFNAGSNVVYTNTFGANGLKYSDEELNLLIKNGIACAKEAAATSERSGEKFVGLDIGPLGRFLKPLGNLEFEDAVNIFATVVRLGVKYGADLIAIETMNDSYETKAALLAAKENCELPVFVTNAYDGESKLVTGATPEVMTAILEGMGADAIGANCSVGPREMLATAKRFAKCASVPVIIKPNAGLPREDNGKTVFDIGPDEFAALACEISDSGVSALGGCCGTSPEYIRRLSERLKDKNPVEITKKNISVVTSYAKSVEIGNGFTIIGERINPTGKKRFKEALRSGDINYILSEGISQEEKGASVLDVNVGLPEINEKEMLTRCTRELQSVTTLPLQLDTTDPEAMEAALRIYNGKAMINSVNGKAEVMNKIFPLCKKYGGVVVALTLDENGIPNTAEGRIAIAEKILKTAEKYGINKKDLVFDPLAMAVSADEKSALVTLESVKMLKERGLNTSLGVSNISFGLPDRDKINASFFTMCLSAGLDCAIMNVYSEAMKGAYLSYMALSGKDPYFRNYTSFFSKETGTDKTQTDEITLTKAIESGMTDYSASLAKSLLADTAPLEIINGQIIPALDRVGKGFETGSVFLPELLMSAEAAKNAFDVLKTAFSIDTENRKCKIILATVEGDIHDIGKNIVRLLLESYGFEVIDLGRDVESGTIVLKAKETGAPIVGLSALMTTTVPAMAETIKLLRDELPNVKTVVGGAVLTEEYAKQIGADKYSADAMETVRYAEEINLQLQNN